MKDIKVPQIIKPGEPYIRPVRHYLLTSADMAKRPFKRKEATK